MQRGDGGGGVVRSTSTLWSINGANYGCLICPHGQIVALHADDAKGDPEHLYALDVTPSTSVS